MKLIIKHGYRPNVQTASLNIYDSDCLLDIDVEDITTIKEYEPLTIIFKADSDNDYFKIPELDDYSIFGRKFDDQSYSFKYLSNKYYHLFNWYDSKDEIQNVPFVPGCYSIEIITDTKKYYSYFRIISKELNDNELHDMRFEVENKLKNLATDFFSNVKMKTKNFNDDNDFSFIDDKVLFLIQNKSKITFALENISKNPKYKISKYYEWTKQGKVKSTDFMTFRKINDKFDQRDRLYAPNRYLNYDVEENRWINYFLLYLKGLCDEYTEKLNNYIDNQNEHFKDTIRYKNSLNPSEYKYEHNKNKKINFKLNNFINDLTELKNYLYFYRKKSYIVNISKSFNIFPSKTVMMSPAYNTIYRIYKQLSSNENNYKLSYYYGKYWKKTALLYEIWTYIKVLESLIELGFVPIKGWIYDNGKDIEFLNDGDHVNLVNNELKINLTYNQSLPSNEKYVDINTPLMTKSNKRKPDIRVDVFTLDNKFLGSIILDAKYKKLDQIKKEFNKTSGNTIRQQFKRYKDDPQSHLFNVKDSFSARLKVVDSVIALYPGKSTIKKDELDNGIYYIGLRPNSNDEQLTKKLRERISSVKDVINILKEN